MVLHKGGLLFTLRKHRKKSIFGAGVFTYATHYATHRFREHQIRQEVFKEAKTYGDQAISPIEKPRRLYVILNPAAHNGKCKALFLKNAAPIFQLAGIDVTLIQTDYEGHAKTTVNYFDPTIDGVVVAGGNGIMLETVTGMFRQRSDEKVNMAALPVGFIPLGRNGNSMYSKLFGTDLYDVRSMCNATMAVVKGHYKETSVLEIDSAAKPIYALSNIHFGAYQEVKHKIDDGKYWLLGPLKKRFAFMWRTVRNWPPPFSITLSCDKAKEGEGSSSDVSNLVTDNFSIYLQEDVDSNDEPVLLVQKRANDIARMDFIRVGWEWLENKLSFTSHEMSETLMCAEVSVKPHDDEGSAVCYDIDGEIFDTRPITVRIDSRKLKVFCNPEGG